MGGWLFFLTRSPSFVACCMRHNYAQVLPKKLVLKQNTSGWKIPISPVEKEAKARLSIKILQAEEVEKKQK